jgi:hypothetical protein
VWRPAEHQLPGIQQAIVQERFRLAEALTDVASLDWEFSGVTQKVLKWGGVPCRYRRYRGLSSGKERPAHGISIVTRTPVP